MRKTTFLKMAVSPLVIGLTMVGCTTTQQTAYGSSRSSPLQTSSADQAGALADQAQQRAMKGDFTGAIDLAEKAVELSPRDLGYRMILADLYMKNGRFLSAKTAYSDVLTLQPGNSRARFNLALTQIALGESLSATVQLDRLAETESPADLGLAYALAGNTARAIDMLEPAARSPEADSRVRQNLALAYALAGDWTRARATAAQDLSPADLAGRMEQWAALATPKASNQQVAHLLGVTPVIDQGQPSRLALAPEPASAPVMQAAVEMPKPVAPAVEIGEITPAPVQYAAAQAPAEPKKAVDQVYAEAAKALVAPKPAVIRTASLPASKPVAAFEPAPKPRVGAGRYVVQVGAYRSAKVAEAAWSKVSRRFGLADYSPVHATVTLDGRGTFHRLSVGGFMDQADARRTCRDIKGQGGSCFVRGVAGDAPIRFASRDNRNS